MIDLRSDTCSRPTADMRTAMANAEVGDVEPVKFLLAHRHHRHRAPRGSSNPWAVSRQLCRGVSSLYCGYKKCRRKIEMSPRAQSRNDTPLGADTTSATLDRNQTPHWD
jgi:hypothetical protein